MKSNIGQWFIHIAGCLAFLALPIVFSPDAHSLSDLWKHPPALKDFTVYFLLILFFYFNLFWLIPQYFFNKRYARFFLVSFTCFAIVVLLPCMLIHGNSEPGSQPAETGYYWPPNNPNPVPAPGMPPPDEGLRQPSRSLPLQLIQNVFLFLAVFFFSLILKINNRRLAAG